MSELPESVRIREVGPRDGFQNEPEVIATDEKVRLIELLGAAGLRRIEVTSFVRPDVIPQLADAEAVLEAVQLPETISISVLIPNLRGLERALAHRGRFHEVNGFLSASETHNRKNVGRSVEESLAGLATMFARARSEGLRCEGVISTSFGCPYEGHVPRERVLSIAAELAQAGCEEIGFGDTTGMANPVQVREFFAVGRARVADRLPSTASTLGRIPSPRAGTSLAESGQRSYFVRPMRRDPAPSVNRISVVAGLSETIRLGTAPIRTGSPKSSRAAADVLLDFSHATMASAKRDNENDRLRKTKTDTPLKGMPATSTRQRRLTATRTSPEVL